jgi:hypothetical protein
MTDFAHVRILVVLVAAAALGGLTSTPAGAQCNHFEPYTLFELGDPNGVAPEYVALDDLDGDGDLDMAVSSYRWDGQLRVAFNAGDATFPEYTLYTAGNDPEALAIGDLDGENGPDIVVVNYDSEYASLYFNDGNGVFSPSTMPTEIYAYGVAIGDLDGDADNDLAIVHIDTGLLTLHLNNGDGTFVAGDVYTMSGAWPGGVAIGDLDGINGPDIVVTNSGWSFDQLLNNGDGTFTQGTVGTPGSYTFHASIADADNDGDNDIAMAHWWSGGAASVFRNNGDATYVSSIYGTDTWACEQAWFADLDGQPGLEFIVLSQRIASGADHGVVSVFTNDGAGNFSNRCNYDVDDPALGMGIGDLNGDGWNDAVVGNYSYGDFTLLLNQAVACWADLDGDDDTDLADLAQLLGNYGMTSGATFEDGDLDGDEDVDLADLAALLGEYGCGS